VKALLTILLIFASAEAFAWGAPNSPAGQLGGQGQNGMSVFQHETMIQRERARVRAEIATEGGNGGACGCSAVGSGDGHAGRAGF
jgi:hypothetical protein